MIGERGSGLSNLSRAISSFLCLHLIIRPPIKHLPCFFKVRLQRGQRVGKNFTWEICLLPALGCVSWLGEQAVLVLRPPGVPLEIRGHWFNISSGYTSLATGAPKKLPFPGGKFILQWMWEEYVESICFGGVTGYVGWGNRQSMKEAEI